MKQIYKRAAAVPLDHSTLVASTNNAQKTDKHRVIGAHDSVIQYQGDNVSEHLDS